MQRVIHKGARRLVGKVWQRNGHRRENRTGEGCTFQDARSSFEIVLSIAGRTARHVGLINCAYLGRQRRHGSFGSCREYGNRQGDHSD
jgi:hypothetical protein